MTLVFVNAILGIINGNNCTITDFSRIVAIL